MSGEPAQPDPRDDQKVTLKAPYPQVYKDAPTDKLSIQYAVKELCQQVGREYDFQESLRLSDAAARKWIRPTIENLSFRDAMLAVLIPEAMVWETVEGKVVISPVVIATGTGKHYHKPGCASAGNGRPVSLRSALSRGLGACEKCHPPKPMEKEPSAEKTTAKTQ